jgi:hypothetical protein
MADRWKYPFYVIALVLLVMWLTSCDGTAQARPASSPAGTTAANADVSVDEPALRPPGRRTHARRSPHVRDLIGRQQCVAPHAPRSRPERMFLWNSELKIPEIQHVISSEAIWIEAISDSGDLDRQSREIFLSKTASSWRLLDSGHSGLRTSRMVTISDRLARSDLLREF